MGFKKHSRRGIHLNDARNAAAEQRMLATTEEIEDAWAPDASSESLRRDEDLRMEDEMAADVVQDQDDDDTNTLLPVLHPHSHILLHVYLHATACCVASQVPRNVCIFLPKFHCELNWIERYWGATKKYTRKHCNYTLAGLRAVVPLGLSQTLDEIPEEMRDVSHWELPVSPVRKQRRWARISLQWASEYRKCPRSSVSAIVQAVNAQRSSRHRDTARMRPAEAEMEEKAARAWRLY